MKVKDLIYMLQDMPQDCDVFAEGEAADRVHLEECPDGHQIVRIFKHWDVEFTSSYDVFVEAGAIDKASMTAARSIAEMRVMTNREFLINALAGELGDEAYNEAAWLINCPNNGVCNKFDKTCLECTKEWLKEEMSE